MIYLISDIHGNVDKAEELLKACPEFIKNIVFLGDIGFGFPEFDIDRFYCLLNNQYQNKVFYLIQGNHDNADCFMNKSNVMAVTTYDWHKIIDIDGVRVLMIPGAFSYDKNMRLPGVSWWDNEEMSYDALSNLIKNYKIADIILSHDAPLTSYFYFFPETKISKTNAALDEILDGTVKSGKSVRWFHGHLHFGYVNQIRGLTLTGVAMENALSVF